MGNQIRWTAVAPFLIITFGLAWTILGLYLLWPIGMASIFGQISGNHPLFFLAVYAPAIAAFIILLVKAGWEGLRRYLKRLFYWRCPPLWAVFLVIGIPLIFYGGSALKGSLFKEPFPFSSLSSLAGALGLAIIKGPVEEFGWRGFALPLLQQKIKPIYASLFIGTVWGLWHLPTFIMSGTQQSGWSFLPFLGGTVAISVIMTALFNASKGSILLAALMHFQLMNPIWPDAAPYDTYILTVIAILLIWIYRRMFFGGENASVEIIP